MSGRRSSLDVKLEYASWREMRMGDVVVVAERQWREGAVDNVKFKVDVPSGIDVDDLR